MKALLKIIIVMTGVERNLAFEFGGMREQNSNGGTTSVRLWTDGGAKLKRWNIQRLTLEG